jgi:molecular chaperone GrpE
MSDNKEFNAEKADQSENLEQNDNNFNLNTDDNAAGTIGLEEELSSNETNEDKYLAEIAELKDKFTRKIAEFENYKRRTAAEMLELRQTAGKEVILSMLEVIDDCERAEQQMAKSDDLPSIKEGVTLVFNKFKKLLDDKGVKAMDAIGSEFDVELHEALTEVPAPNKNQVGKVMDVIQKGYYLRDKLIRFAKVIVGK